MGVVELKFNKEKFKEKYGSDRSLGLIIRRNRRYLLTNILYSLIFLMLLVMSIENTFNTKGFLNVLYACMVVASSICLGLVLGNVFKRIRNEYKLRWTSCGKSYDWSFYDDEVVVRGGKKEIHASYDTLTRVKLYGDRLWISLDKPETSPNAGDGYMGNQLFDSSYYDGNILEVVKLLESKDIEVIREIVTE